MRRLLAPDRRTRLCLAAVAGLTAAVLTPTLSGPAQANPAGPAPANPTGPAQSGGNPYSPAYQHPYRHGVIPTLDTTAKMHEWDAQHAQAQDSANNIHYDGGVDGIGVTSSKEQVYLVFWGTQWGTAGTDGSGNTTFTGDASGLAPRVQLLFKGLGNGGENWSGVMTQYCEGVAAGTQICPLGSVHVAYPTGGALAGVWYDNSGAAPANASALQLGNEAVAAASHFGNTNAILNRGAQYVVISPAGTHPDGFPSTGFCAWHDWNGDVGAASSVGDIAFTNLPYVPDAGFGCGANFVNAGSAGALDGVTIVEGHEYAETITDQNPPGGWTGPGDENGDKCIWISSGPGASANVAFTTGTFAMQTTWSNLANGTAGGCEMARTPIGRDPFTAAYVWNDRPSQAGCYQPSAFYSFNTRRAVNTICRTGTGTYVVHFADVASGGGNVQVTAYGGSPTSCKVTVWVPSGTEEQVGVACYSFAGAPQDSYFTAEYTAGGGSGNTIAFAWAHSPATASYVPSTTYQYNSRGGPGTVTRTGTGSYQIAFPISTGPTAAGTVKITAYGGGSGVCKSAGWGPSGGNEVVFVQCYNSAGAASDEVFSVLYADGQNLMGDNVVADGYTWANQPASASYTPALSYQRSTTIASSGTVTITRSGTGSYDVFLPFQDQGLDGGHVQVTAYGGGTERCQVGYWFGTTGGRIAHIYCFTNAGAAVDTYYVVEYAGRVQ